MIRKTVLAVAVIGAFGLVGCDDSPKSAAKPTATTLADAKPKALGAQAFTIATSGSKVEFVMEAPKEKIRGRANDTMRGEVQIDLADLTKTTAHLYVDIGGLELYQRKAADDGSFGEETKNDTQNAHARTWLEIGDDVPADHKKKNSNVEFVIKKVETSTADVTKLKGDERKLKATITGTFLLHQVPVEKTATFEITFKMKGEKAESIRVKTVKPFAINLADHNVRPRTAFGKLAEKTLDMLAPKVAKEAVVNIDFSAKLTGAVKNAAKSKGGEKKKDTKATKY